MKFDKSTYRLTDAGGIPNVALIAGVLGLIGSGVSFTTSRELFFPAYLTSFMFWTSIGLGALFFTLLHHLVGATWSVVVRRLVETVMVNLPIMALLFIPVVLALHDLYHWSHPNAVAVDKLLQHKQPYLNENFFVFRALLYFAIWSALGFSLYRSSLRHDEAQSDSLIEKMRCISAPGMLLFALSLTFAAFDWLMSLDPHWYSTIFGVYIFAGSLLSILAFTTVTVSVLRANGVLVDEITVEHYHDLGKLTFAFTVFWTYIAFSQYFLIWYGNIPEETVWYLHRWENHWKVVSLFLVGGHFVFPFLALLSRVPKRNVTVMTAMSCWMLFIHWVDMYWIIMPNFNHHFHPTAKELFAHATTLLAIGGIFVFMFWKRFASKAIVPINDPKLAASMSFVNG